MSEACAPLSYASHAVIAGKYELLYLLGQGGMGSIWRARHLSLDTDVALKVIRADMNRADCAPRLLLEARAAARLGHPAIVRVTDVGEVESGHPYLVMELLEGEGLASLLVREEKLEPVHAVRLLLPIVDALCAAHSRGIVHRDLKPENVFLSNAPYGLQPKLLDFGIAMFAYERAPTRLTEMGTVVGSPDYMSPEQASGEEIDHRTDVWSFCVMLYECITGKVPFRASNYHAQLRTILEREPDLRGIDDRELVRILRTGLKKKRELRYPNMSELGYALAKWLRLRGAKDDICGASLEARWFGIDGRVTQKTRIEVVTSDSLVGKVNAFDRTLVGGVSSESWFSARFSARSGRLKRGVTVLGAMAALAGTGFVKWRGPSKTSIADHDDASVSTRPSQARPVVTIVEEPLPGNDVEEDSAVLGDELASSDADAEAESVAKSRIKRISPKSRIWGRARREGAVFRAPPRPSPSALRVESSGPDAR